MGGFYHNVCFYCKYWINNNKKKLFKRTFGSNQKKRPEKSKNQKKKIKLLKTSLGGYLESAWMLFTNKTCYFQFSEKKFRRGVDRYSAYLARRGEARRDGRRGRVCPRSLFFYYYYYYFHFYCFQQTGSWVAFTTTLVLLQILNK